MISKLKPIMKPIFIRKMSLKLCITLVETINLIKIINSFTEQY